MQDDGIHANLRYTQQAYVATVMKVTHAIFLIVNVLFLYNHIFCIPRNYMFFYAVYLFGIRKLFKRQKKLPTAFRKMVLVLAV